MAAKSGPADLEGTLERVVFHNPSTQWTVAQIAPRDGSAEVTAVGSLVGLAPGTPVRLFGNWVVDPRYGRQFRVDSYQTQTPETLRGIERYLGSGLIPGIGPALAKRIVERFGLETLEVIGHKPERLEAVEGIGKGRAGKIARAWVEQRDIQNVMVFLQGHGVSSTYAARIYRHYGAEAIGIVRNNPYRLALDIWGIGFKSADAIASRLGLAKAAPSRLEAGLLHVLGNHGDEGHVHVPQAHLLPAAAALLEVGEALVARALENLVTTNLVTRETLGERGPCISLPALWECEQTAAAALDYLLRTPRRPFPTAPEAAITAFEKEAGLHLAPRQKEAIRAAASDKCVVITGGPGVGKTTIVRAIVRIFAGHHQRIALAAPTGRAAKRLGESTAMEAQTIHRLLEFQPREGAFLRCAEQPLEVDAVLVDEASMIDIGLFRALVVAIPPRAQLILVGDIDQLPSVGPGAVLADIIHSGRATVVRLTEIFRQAASSQIVVNAHRINEGREPDLSSPDDPSAERDFYFIARSDPIAARELLVELVADHIPRRFGFDPATEIQVLTPMHRGDLGTQALNTVLQQRLNPLHPGTREIRRGDRALRAGDKVMQIRNNYEKSVFNGDIGLVVAVTEKAPPVAVRFGDGRLVHYEREELDQLVHAFAVSVHKSQGSEYPAVVIPLVTQHYIMLQRNLLYTAITRGKKLVVLLGSKKAVHLATANSATRLRWTWLAERLRTAS